MSKHVWRHYQYAVGYALAAFGMGLAGGAVGEPVADSGRVD